MVLSYVVYSCSCWKTYHNKHVQGYVDLLNKNTQNPAGGNLTILVTNQCGSSGETLYVRLNNITTTLCMISNGYLYISMKSIHFYVDRYTFKINKIEHPILSDKCEKLKRV